MPTRPAFAQSGKTEVLWLGQATTRRMLMLEPGQKFDF